MFVTRDLHVWCLPPVDSYSGDVPEEGTLRHDAKIPCHEVRK